MSVELSISSWSFISSCKAHERLCAGAVTFMESHMTWKWPRSTWPFPSCYLLYLLSTLEGPDDVHASDDLPLAMLQACSEQD